MARNNDRDRGRRTTKEARPTRGKKKICVFCAGKVDWVDYKDVNTLRRFTSDRGKIRARRVTGNCAQHQRDVAVAIKTARELALLPYTQRTVTERGPGRGRDRDRGGPSEGRGERAAPVPDEDAVDVDADAYVADDDSDDEEVGDEE